jgi:Endosomal/lysosomal potassium channel TMEM175
MITRLARAAGHRRIRLRILAGTVRTAAAARQETGSRHHVGHERAVQPLHRAERERLTALADGLFAVAMTLLVLDRRVPVSAAGPARRAMTGRRGGGR